MDRRDVVKWLRSNPDVDVTALASEAKAEWSCTTCVGRTVTATREVGGDIETTISGIGHIYLKPDDAAAFARHILELVKQ